MEKVTIMDVAAEGKAIAKVNDLVIFVPYVVPGDVVSFTSCRPIALFLSANIMAYAVAASGKCSPIQSRSDISKSKWKII